MVQDNKRGYKVPPCLLSLQVVSGYRTIQYTSCTSVVTLCKLYVVPLMINRKNHPPLHLIIPDVSKIQHFKLRLS